ncbi:MAG: hypothetical protein UU66_C0030G0008 [Parcubacteria group bacterium GW2011_GWB1_41_5]|nr:MAG: hypothetical protein UU66_C0030G0008 [Parcubacteria group bacterium GW2011_GWB1_41_5]
MNDLTIIYYSANTISPQFYEHTKNALLKAAGDISIISVSHKPMDLGKNICVGDIGASNINIYKQLLIGAKEATTEYIATAEDDTLYSASHFTHRPTTTGVFAYNMNKWSLFTWSEPPIFSNRGRRTLNAMIAPRKLLIEALEERFAKYPKDEMIQLRFWGELGRYEKYLGVTVRETEQFQSEIPIIMFNHPESLNYKQQGERKRLGIDRAFELPYWGKASDVVKLHQ